MKRFVLLAGLLAALAGRLVAAGAPESAVAARSTASISAAATSAANPKIDITFMHVFGGSQGKVIDELVDKFNESQQGVTVAAQQVPGWYTGLLQKLQVLAAARELPAVTLAAFSYTNYMNGTMPVVPIADFARAESFDFGDFSPAMLKLGQDRAGEQIALPFAVSTPVIYANLDAFKSANIDFVDQPQSWEQLREWAKELTSTDRKGISFQMDFDTWVFQTLLDSYGGSFASMKDKKILFNSEQGVHVLQFLLDMLNKDHSYAYVNGSQAAQSFQAGNLGMLVASSGNLGELQKGLPFKLGVMMLPKSAPGYARRLPAGGSAIYVMKTTSEQQRAGWDFVKYATSAQGSALVALGMGYMAPRSSAIAQGGPLTAYLDRNPLAAATYRQGADIENWFNWPGTSGPMITKTMLDQIQAAFTGQKSAQQALDDAAAQAAQILGWN